MFAEIKVLKTYNPLDYLDETNIVYVTKENSRLHDQHETH
jgi:hypothetical protein